MKNLLFRYSLICSLTMYNMNNMKNLFSRYLLYTLIVVVSLVGAYLFLENQQIKAQNNQVLQITKSLRIIKMIAAVDSTRISIVNKVSTIISKYNSDLDERTRQEYATEIYKMTLKYDNLDIDLISATITHESARTWEYDITSHVGAMGLMQIMPATGRFLASQEGIEWTNSKDILYNPITNIRLGSRYLSMLIAKYSKRMGRDFAVEAALAAYNGGEKRVAYWISKNRKYKYLWKETRTYIPRVLDLYADFASIAM